MMLVAEATRLCHRLREIHGRPDSDHRREERLEGLSGGLEPASFVCACLVFQLQQAEDSRILFRLRRAPVVPSCRAEQKHSCTDISFSTWFCCNASSQLHACPVLPEFSCLTPYIVLVEPAPEASGEVSTWGPTLAVENLRGPSKRRRRRPSPSRERRGGASGDVA